MLWRQKWMLSVQYFWQPLYMYIKERLYTVYNGQYVILLKEYLIYEFKTFGGT